MALNLDAIKQKMATLNGERKNSNFWYPEVGNYVIRVLAWPEGKTSDSTPFAERYFYYIGGNKPVLAPKQFGDVDPVDDLARAFWRSGKPEDKETAKKLMPRMKAFMPVLVKGEEAKGVQLWSFNKEVYNRLLELMLKEDIGDFTDLKEGFNLEVSVKNTDRKFNGKTMTSMSIDAARRATPTVAWFDNDDDKMHEVLSKTPDIDAIYPRKTSAEIQRILDAWINEGEEATDTTAGTARGASVADQLDNIAAEITTSRKKEVVVEIKGKKKQTNLDDLDENVPSKTKKNLDDAFAELEND